MAYEGDMQNNDPILRSDTDGVASLTLNAPKSINAFMGMARVIADKSPSAVKIGKRAFYEQLEMPLSEAYEFAGRIMAENMMAEDAEAGIGAFTRKEPMPDWTGE